MLLPLCVVLLFVLTSPVIVCGYLCSLCIATFSYGNISSFFESVINKKVVTLFETWDCNLFRAVREIVSDKDF